MHIQGPLFPLILTRNETITYKNLGVVCIIHETIM